MSFTTVLMGAESLLVQCAEILIGRGHTVREVVTDNPDIVQWAAGRGVRVVPPGKDLADRLAGPHTDGARAERGAVGEGAPTDLLRGGRGLQSSPLGEIDWFFSIANLRIVPDDVLAMAGKGAINFHDGPLPKYAGLNAPIWALLNRETQHGITWHRIEGAVDEGRLLEQRFFDVPPLATALELNTTCYEHAIESFSAVVERLERGDDGGERQDLGKRSYFGKNDRPEAVGLLDWSQDAETLVAQVRALDFGPKYANPLNVAKIRVGEVVLLVTGAEPAHSSGAPGTILEVATDGVVVAAGTGAVKITALQTQAGEGVELTSLEGRALSSGDTAERARLTERNAALCPADDFWSTRLRSLELAAFDAGHAPIVDPLKPREVDVGSVPLVSESTGTAWLSGVVAWLARISGAETFDVGFQGAATAAAVAGDEAFFASAVPLRVDASGTVRETAASIDADIARVDKRLSYARDLVARHPDVAPPRHDLVLAPAAEGLVADSAVTLTEGRLFFDRARLDEVAAKSLASRIEVVLREARRSPDARVASLSLLDAAEREQVIDEWNRTDVAFDADSCVHQLFEAQVDRTPDATALTFEGASLSYRELDARANQVAHVLRDAGVGAESVVGLFCHRSLELVVGALGILKAGGAYLPLDPEYPADRIALMLEDSRAKVVVTHGEARPALRSEVKIVDLDGVDGDATRLSGAATSKDLAYIIYTSGSTGRPKGVMVEHRQVSNFFTGMDARIPTKDRKVWMAVTSLSFDISVLELFWTLSRGFEVVVFRDRKKSGAVSSGRKMDFGLFYWGNDDGQGAKKYELLLEGAKLADRSGFTSLWTPERHFHAFGGPYPNPAVTGAAVAAITQNLDIRAGSCVAPLHHPIRIAEEWAVIDNLTGGRVGLAFAAGWQPDDFVLRPENTPPKNKAAMLDSVDVVRRLWRGEAVPFPKEDGSMFEVVTQPRPMSKELAVWVTTAGNPDTYRDAAAKGANVLTHLLGQSIEEVGEKIQIYRDALREHGHDPADFKVTLMLHTYLDETREKAREVAREPMKGYLRAAAGLIKQYAWAFPAFKKPAGVTNAFEIDLEGLSTEEMDAILDFAFQRYFEDSGFFGTVDDAVARVEELKAIGVDEVACLVDYGVETPDVLRSLERVAEVVKRTSRPVMSSSAEDQDQSIGAQLTRHRVSHMQSTPSMARLLMLDDSAAPALRELECYLVGGEALPGALVSDLRAHTRAHIENMYGPTETTIWSSTFTAGSEASKGDAITPIGTPIANTRMYVLDANRQPLPVGVAGELYIGGEGVTRGYLYRDELTADRFVADPFRTDARMYRTGDLVRWRGDGVLEFIGRVDHQVKLRGYRIELGEIEARLNAQGGVREAVVMAREDQPGDMRLVAYLTTSAEVDEDALKARLAKELPEYMVPSHIVTLDAFPLTPNKKVDRKQLPAPGQVKKASAAPFVAPTSDVEEKIAGVWRSVLGVERVSTKDNFFDLGGHSLLAVQAHRELKAALGTTRLSITDIFRFPTLGALAGYVQDESSGSEKLDKTAARAAARREAMRRRRG